MDLEPAIRDTHSTGAIRCRMATMAELRDRQRVRVALFKGKPVSSDDYDTVRLVLAQVRWYPPLALIFAIVCCLWLRMLLFGHGMPHSTALLGALGTGGMTLVLLLQRRRIVAGARKTGFRHDE